MMHGNGIGDPAMTTVSYRQKWIETGRLKRVLAKINDGTSVNADGAIQFDDFDFQQYFDLLADAFHSPDTLTPREISSLVYSACIDLRKLGPVQRDKLLGLVNKKASEALAVAPRPFTMWTQLRLRQMVWSRGFKLSFQDVRIEGRARLPKRYRLTDYLISGHGYIRPNKLSDFAYLILRCDARNEEDAARKMFDAIDTFYAVSNLIWRSINMWTDPHAQAYLWLGPYQFFWQGQKFLGKERIWYNPKFDEAEWQRFPKDAKDFLVRLPHIRKALADLQPHPLRQILSPAAKLVHEGKASPDLSFRLLRYWSALETLYSEGSNKNVPYDKLIRRATFGERDRELAILKLEHLAKLRNSYVHSGDTERERNELTQFLGEILAHQILYLLRYADDLADHNELIEMADLPNDLNLLARRRRAIERRENIIQFGRHRGQ
jgi:hypothetical protein